MIFYKIFFINFLITSCFCRLWDKKVIDEYVNAVRNCWERPAITIGIVELDENDQIKQSYAHSYGRIDPTCNSRCAQPTNTTRFCIGSITKQFTSGVLGKALTQSKKFASTSWDTKLVDILGDRGKFFKGKPPAEQATLKDLLAHRMGIPRHDGGWMFGVDKPRDEVLSNAHTLNTYDPSTYWRKSFVYNNWMYDLAGYVAEQITGDSYEKLIKSYYFSPLEMHDSKLIHEVGKDFSGFAVVALKTDEGWQSVPLWQIGNISVVGMADGSICSSSNDFIKYMKLLLTKDASKLTPEQRDLLETIKEGWKPVATYDEPEIYQNASAEYTYGLGWGQGVWRGYDFVGHDGATEGWFSSMRVLPDAKVGVFVSTTNSIDDDDETTSLIANWLTDYVLGFEPILTKETACDESPQKFSTATRRHRRDAKFLSKIFSKLNPHAPKAEEEDEFTFNCDFKANEMQPFLGVYEHPMFGTVTVSNKNGTMRWSFGHFGRGSLCKTTPNTDLDSNDFRMKFDDDTYYKTMNDPQTNLNSDAVFKFDHSGNSPNARAVNLDVVETEVPVIFNRKIKNI